MEWIVLEQMTKVGLDQERLKKILNEASKQRHVRLTTLESERSRLERELKILMESLPQKTESMDRDKRPPNGLETIRENIGHLERRLAETQEQVQALQQQPLEVEEAAQALMALEKGFEELPVIEQARLIQLMVRRVDYDGAQSKLALALDPAGLVAVLEEQTKQKETTK
jgi:hypothetical protein